MTLKITEIFYSLQGETATVGLPTVFVRLTGCPLRCGYCDTAYAFQGGRNMTQEEVLTKVANYMPRYVTVTGGEPLAQKACLPLLSVLCDQGYQVSLETSGALSIAEVDARVFRVVDFKTPGSLEVARNLWDNVDYLLPHDQVKFVICDRADYEWALEAMKKFKLAQRCEVLLSPSHGQLENKTLAGWMLEDRVTARFQIQLHKFIWGDMPGV